MKKWLRIAPTWLLTLIPIWLFVVFFVSKADPQSSEYQTIVLSGTADLLVDSTLTTTYMSGRRLYINGVYLWWDNAANTNMLTAEIIRGQTAFVTQGLRRQWKYAEAMTSGGIKGVAMTPNITTGPDSTIYFVISGASSDSLYMAVNYKLVN